MNLDWSEQSPHIRSLFRPWQDGDGYDEDALQLAESRLGLQLPGILRSFYLTWGKRKDMTNLNHWLQSPEKLVVKSDALIFCVENQGIEYWGIQVDMLGDVNPPVVIAEAGPEMSVWQATSELAWILSHEHVSSFLDDLIYMHAFAGGALHGAHAGHQAIEPRQFEWLEKHWRKANAPRLFHGLRYGTPEESRLGSPLYIRDAQALFWFQDFSAVARDAETLDEIAQKLGITWAKRW